MDRTTILPPEVGAVDLHCEEPLTPDEGIALHAFFSAEGTDAREKLELLAVIGSQVMRSR